MVGITNAYYKSLTYIIEKKITVEDNPKVKDYIKDIGIYVYVLFDMQDKNRFFFFSCQNFAEGTKIHPETFKIFKISSEKDSIHLIKKKAKFNEPYFRLSKNKGEHTIILSDVIFPKNKDGKSWNKYKAHTKKIFLDYPDWYIEHLKIAGCKSIRKKFEREILSGNQYSPEILEHFISTLFILRNEELQRLNDSALVLTEGMTGKSSIIAYMSEKADDISMAGLYGSSDGTRGHFREGLVGQTKSAIIVDELNELIEHKKGEKVLSVLNTILENGRYHYRKQFSAVIKSQNQFILMGNLTSSVNLATILEGTVSNLATIGRRFGVVTYNLNLSGFTKGGHRPLNPTTFMRAVSIFLTNIFNHILYETKFLDKILAHKEFAKLEANYKVEIGKLSVRVENETVLNFLKSHQEAGLRILTRGLKNFLYFNLDNFLSEKMPIWYGQYTFEAIRYANLVAQRNIINLQNVVEHVNDYQMSSRRPAMNLTRFQDLKETHKRILKVFWVNKDNANIREVELKTLKEISIIDRVSYNLRKKTYTPDFINSTLRNYGCRIFVRNNEIYFSIMNKKVFLDRLEGVFDEPITPDTDKKDDTEMTDLF